MFNIGLFLVFVHLVPYAIQNNIHRTAAARAVGLIYDHVGHHPPAFMIGTLTFMTAGVIALSLTAAASDRI
jgi:hypothetical protein